MQVFMNWLNRLRQVGQKAGPYLLLEILLPGGTLCALLLFLWQRRNPPARMSARGVIEALMRAASALEPSLLVPAPARMAVRLSKAGSIERL